MQVFNFFDTYDRNCCVIFTFAILKNNDSRNFFVLDFARSFFVSCAPILEALALRLPLKPGATGKKSAAKASA